MKRLAAACLAGACALLPGCSLFRPAPAEGRPAESEVSLPARLFARSNSEELVAYLDRLRGMGEAALEAELTRQRQALQREANDLARIKTALALTLARSGEDGDILSLVEPIARKPGADADLKAMASFLQVIAADRRRLRESAAAAGARLRDERRATEAQKQRADALQERATALQERATQLQQKLDALTEIEKSLSDRQPSSR